LIGKNVQVWVHGLQYKPLQSELSSQVAMQVPPPEQIPSRQAVP
jgi:hypothetical protein